MDRYYLQFDCIKHSVFCSILFTKLYRILCVHHSATMKNPLKIEYEIIPKRQRLTEDIGISEKLANNISFYESFNPFITLYLLKEYVDDANANGYLPWRMRCQMRVMIVYFRDGQLES